MSEIVIGMILLLLGRLCFSQVSLVRARHAQTRVPGSRLDEERPLMLVRTVLGVLLILSGIALLALAGFERLRAAGGS